MAPLDATPADRDPLETQEWVDALKGVLENEGPDRAHYLIERLIDVARKKGAYLPFSANTDYINTLPHDLQPKLAGIGRALHHLTQFPGRVYRLALGSQDHIACLQS